jgi:ABC-type polysaccharide/polyol phosphate transport system ATPase subunit/glycosyltransferase involved in cell wall biosynthesis
MPVPNKAVNDPSTASRADVLPRSAPVVSVTGLGKRYWIRERRQSLVETGYRWLTRTPRTHDSFWALRDVTFSVGRRESLAVVGANGAGKTTLLKLIGGIATASTGQAKASGRISLQFGLGAGFHPYLTGIENAELQGTILGLTNAEVQRRMPAIAAFADLGDAIERPLWTYSSGMAARLGFSVAVHVDFDILLLDEALSAGDIGFRNRCRERMLSFRKAGKTMIIVSHGSAGLRELCDRALWLEGGRMRDLGPTSAVIDAYERQPPPPVRSAKRNAKNVARVGVLCDTFEIGGQEIGCLEFLRRLDRRRFTPHLYTFRPGALLDAVRSLDVPVIVGHNKPGSDHSWTAADQAAREAYRLRLASDLRADAIDVCMVYAWPDGIEAARDAGVRAIVERVDGPSLLGRTRDKTVCQRVICESQTVRQLILAQRGIIACVPERLVVIPNGIDLARFNPDRYDRDGCREALALEPDAFVVGTVGRLAEEKNIGHLLTAVEYLAKIDASAARRVRVLIVGPDGGERASLEAQVSALGLTDRVRFLGPRSDVPALLRALDAFALCSRYEGVPLALLEAMAMGLPAVATGVGSIPEVVDGNAYLVQEPYETARALLELIRDPSQCEQLGHRGRLRARHHDIVEMIHRYEAVIEESLAEVASEG